MTQKEMLLKVQTQLALELNCAVADLSCENEEVIFVDAKENPGRRPFPRKERHFDIVSMGKAIVVSATPERLEIAKAQMQGRDRDSIFTLPLIRGLWLHYLPDLKSLKQMLPPEGFSFEMVDKEQFSELLLVKDFKEALIYDPNHPYQNELAVAAKKDGEVIGVASGCKPCSGFWQIGIDVFPEYRNFGLATYLVNRLTNEILNRGFIPTYSTKASNLAAQKVAYRAGYSIAWVSDWRCNFQGLEIAG
jgi:GNAT superfamily N-acetyltransferase